MWHNLAISATSIVRGVCQSKKLNHTNCCTYKLFYRVVFKAYSTRQYSTVQHSTPQYTTVQYSTKQYSVADALGIVSNSLIPFKNRRVKLLSIIHLDLGTSRRIICTPRSILVILISNNGLFCSHTGSIIRISNCYH